MITARSGLFASASLTPALGRQNDTTSPYAKAPIILHAADRSRGSSRPAIAIARLTLSRPPHPIPNVRDDRDTPLQGRRDGFDMHLIWVRREAKYFCKRGLTRFLKIRSDLPVGLICRSPMQKFDLPWRQISKQQRSRCANVQSSMSSPRTRGPIRRGPAFGTVANGFCSNRRRWLWVPAFAGTTSGWRPIPSRRVGGVRFPAAEGGGF